MNCEGFPGRKKRVEEFETTFGLREYFTRSIEEKLRVFTGGGVAKATASV